MVTVRVATALRTLTNGQATVEASPGTVAEVMREVEATYPGFDSIIFDDAGSVRRFLDFFVGENSIRSLDGLDTPVADGETLVIMSAVAGG